MHPYVRELHTQYPPFDEGCRGPAPWSSGTGGSGGFARLLRGEKMKEDSVLSRHSTTYETLAVCASGA